MISEHEGEEEQEDEGGVAQTPSKFDPSTLHRLKAAREDLAQSLRKLSYIKRKLNDSGRTLQGLADWLPLLESQLHPLREEAYADSVLAARIDEAVARASSVLGIIRSIRALQERLLSDDPKIDLRKYLALICTLERYAETLVQSYGPSLDWLDLALVYIGQSRAVDKYNFHRLADELARCRTVDPFSDLVSNGSIFSGPLLKLENEFYRLLVGHGPVVDLVDLLKQEGEVEAPPSSSLHPDVMSKLLVIADRLKVHGRVEVCLRMYKEARVVVMRETLAMLRERYVSVSSAEKLDVAEWEEVHDHIFWWVKQVKAVVKVLLVKEREVCAQLFGTVGIAGWEMCFGEVLEGSNLGLLFKFAEAVARSHQRPEALLVGLLDMFKTMQDVALEGSLVFDMCPPHSTALSALRVLQKALVQNISRAFWELVRDVAACRTPVRENGGKDYNASFVVNYMGMIGRDYRAPMDAAIRLMQQQYKPNPANPLVNLSTSSRSIMAVLEKNLEERSREYTNPALPHLFVMNNLRHVLVRLKECKGLAECLGEDWQKEWKKKIDKHLRLFLKMAWEHVVAHLSRDAVYSSSGGRGISSDVVRSKLRAFNQAFEEAYCKQIQWIIFDPPFRDSTRLSIVQLVVPTYNSFLDSFAHHLFEDTTAHRSKLVKYSVATLEAMIGELFEGKALPTGNGSLPDSMQEHQSF